MKEEIAAAVFFVTRLAKRYGSLDNDGRDRLAATLTSVLFEKYKEHWDPEAPSRGQAYRCLRMNRMQHRDSVLEQACIRSMVRYEDLGLPGELTLWVDPGEVSCRYGERTDPICVSVVENSSSRRRADSEFSRRIQNAVDRAFLDVPSGGGSSDEEDGSSRDTSLISSAGSSSSGASGGSLSPPRSSLPSRPAKPQTIQTIPTVSNPNSVYKITEFSAGAPQSWVAYPKRKAFPGEGFPPHPPPPPAFGGGGQGQSSSHFAPHQQHHQGSFRPYVRPSFIFSGPRVDKYHWVSKSRS